MLLVLSKNITQLRFRNENPIFQYYKVTQNYYFYGHSAETRTAIKIINHQFKIKLCKGNEILVNNIFK